MIKQFKQHIVPFVITTRKIFTIFLSIIFYHHKTTSIQLSGVFIVFLAVIFEFASELKKEDTKPIPFEKVAESGEELETERRNFSSE
jgi:hypothetical protein